MKALNRNCLVFALVCLMAASPALGKSDNPFDFLGFIKAAYDAYNRIKNFLEPDPNLADLILQAKDEIIDEINLVRAEEEMANVEALIEEYTIYLNNPPSPITIDAWISDAIHAANQFEFIIGDPNKSPRIAYLSAKSYNMLIPLMALMMQRHGIRTQDIIPLLEDAIATNKALIGKYCWDELPNAPIYWDVVYGDGTYVGKLLKCYHEGVIDWPEYLNIYDIVWTANEECRKVTIDNYGDIWFYISSERGFEGQPISPDDNKYLCAHSRPYRTEAMVSVADLREGDTDFLWRLEYQTGRRFKLVHWSGKYLAEAPDKNHVIITSAPELPRTIWYFVTYYHDRPGIRVDDEDQFYLAASEESAYMSFPGVVPSVGQRWIFQYATRKATGIGYSAFPCPADYDGDGKRDLGLKINDGLWLIDYADNGFGVWDRQISSLPYIDKYSQPALADYDGDGKADISIKNDTTGNWYVDYAANGFGNWDFTRYIMSPTFFYEYHPVPADYDGDGKADFALFQNTGGWSIDYSANGFQGWDDYPHSWGYYYPQKDIYPAPADYDGDGKTDVSIKQDDGRWHFDLAHNAFVWTNDWDLITATAVNYGDITAHAVPGAYFWSSWYHHRADLAVWTESGRWMIDSYLAVGSTPIDWTSEPIYGSKHAFPIPADYDGDGMMDLSVIEEDGTWRIDYSTNGLGALDWSSVVSIITGVSLPEQSHDYSTAKIEEYSLLNYPNPFNANTTIRFSLPQAGHVMIKIFDILGEEIVTLAEETKDAGEYSVVWDGRDRFGRVMPTGIYLCQMCSQNTTVRKMLLLR